MSRPLPPSWPATSSWRAGLLLGLLLTLGAALGGCLQFQQGPVQYPGQPFAYVEIDGLKIHYRELAPPGNTASETVVLLHGYGGALVSWLHAQPVLARTYRTISLDLKGFGLSDKPAGDYSIEAQAALVTQVLDRLQVGRAHLVAHSWGSSVALTLALRHPERVGKVVLVSGFVYDEQLNGFLRWAKAPVVGEVLFGLLYNEQLEGRYTWGFYEPARFIRPEHFEYLRQFQATPGVTAAALAVARGMDLATLQRSYPTIDKEALLIWGANDRVSPVRFGQRLATDLPRARLVTLARAGHNSMIERAGTFAVLVGEFLRG